MEDPTTFDLWGTVLPEHHDEARELLLRARPEMPRLAVLQAIAKGISMRQEVLLVQNVGWRDVQGWKTEMRKVLGCVRVYQSGYSPSDEPRMCECPIHRLYYSGCLGCPVCEGRNAE